MEPAVVLMGRGPEYADLIPLKIDTTERHPGDGMEASLTHDGSLSPSSYKKTLATRKSIRSPKSPKTSRTNIKNIKCIQSEKKKKKKSKSDVQTYSMDDLSVVTRTAENYPSSHLDFSLIIDSLKRKLVLCEDHNSQLIEEKMKLSHQLGIQTQVNNELKNLLVASIGDDLEQKYERMIQDKYLADLELRHLHSVLEEDREEAEQAVIQADVWRSKFLASKVMTDELGHWKSVLYYKYRETHTALQTLLEEHSKIRALNQATRKGLINVVDLLNCKDPSLDYERRLTTMDVAYMNNDLTESIFELLSEPKTTDLPKIKFDVEDERLLGAGEDESDDQLTHGESLAQEAVLNTDVQSTELSRMRHDYLAHNRISHFLSTNYQVTFNCCENCTGTLEVI